MAGADDAGTGPCGSDGVELTLRLGCPAAPALSLAARRNLTMVYGRSVLFAVDVAELQARAIISMANREITGQVKDRDGGVAQLDQGMAPEAAYPNGGSVSMKRSLQRFLEKRKARVAAAASPYVVIHRRPAQPPES